LTPVGPPHEPGADLTGGRPPDERQAGSRALVHLEEQLLSVKLGDRSGDLVGRHGCRPYSADPPGTIGI
jgi:hypothetical protein